MTNRTCIVDECARPARSRKMCNTHYSRWLRHGDPLAGARPTHPPECTSEGCSKKTYKLGLCGMHYQRLKKTGSTEIDNPRYTDTEESFAARTAKDGDCIVWTGLQNPFGYGVIHRDGKKIPAHRYAWERVNGPIPGGMVIDHMCWNRACVNVEHMRLATQAQNTQNLSGPRATSKSGIRGVSWVSARNRWLVTARVGGKRYSAGTFVDKEEAGIAAAKLRAEVMTHSQN